MQICDYILRLKTYIGSYIDMGDYSLRITSHGNIQCDYISNVKLLSINKLCDAKRLFDNGGIQAVKRRYRDKHIIDILRKVN